MTLRIWPRRIICIAAVGVGFLALTTLALILRGASVDDKKAMSPRQIVTVLMVGVALLILVLELIRRHMLREKYSLLWFFIALLALSVPVLYRIYARIANFLGIQEVANFFFYLSIVVLFLLAVQFTIAISVSSFRSKTLSQQVALLEERLRELEDQLRQSEPASKDSSDE